VKDFLSARDVSQLLGINGKKVYTLAHEGKIPGTKVTGKWLFPKRELEELLRTKAQQTIKRFSFEYAVNKNLLLIAGSDDPLMYMVQGLLHSMYPHFVLFSASVGSAEGLRLLKEHCCHIALSHLYDHSTGDFNFPFIGELFENPDELVIINLFYRTIGFLSKESPLKSFQEIITKKLRLINRQKGSGIRKRIESMVSDEEVNAQEIPGYNEEVYTHLDVAYHILSGNANAGIATESVASCANLRFSRLFEERFDMVTHKETFFDKNIQAFVEFIRSDSFSHLLHTMKGYDNRETGKVLYEIHND